MGWTRDFADLFTATDEHTPETDGASRMTAGALRRIREGHWTRQDVLDAVVQERSIDHLDEEIDTPAARAAAETAWATAAAIHEADRATWPAITDCDRIDAAFAELEADHIMTRQRYACCCRCGDTAIHDEVREAVRSGTRPLGYAFYHRQDVEAAVGGYGLAISYGAVDQDEEARTQIGYAVVARLTDAGLCPFWNGDPEDRILIPVAWQKRRVVHAKMHAIAA